LPPQAIWEKAKEQSMETINMHTVIGPDGKVRIEVPCHLPPGPAEVVVVIGPAVSSRELMWRDFYGLGRDLWQDEDAQDYVNRLRDEWHNEPAR
jgi:hypothetical protein